MEESVKLIDILSKHYPHIFGFVFRILGRCWELVWHLARAHLAGEYGLYRRHNIEVKYNAAGGEKNEEKETEYSGRTEHKILHVI